MPALRSWSRDASGAVADLGVLAPITAALVLGNGLDASTALVGLGALYLCAGLFMRVPVPVQPIKAAAAIAIAKDLPTETLATAGLILGVLLTLLGLTGVATWLARVFPVPIVRGLQLGIGLILIRTAVSTASPDEGLAALALALLVALALVVAARSARRFPIGLGIAVLGIAYTAISSGGGPSFEPGLWQPRINTAAVDPSVVWSAFVLLVIPQVPLTLGNAVVAVVDLEHRYYPTDARRVSARSISLSSGLANIASGWLTGMPMCHGSGGLTAHYRAGARSYRMNLIIGSALLLLGLFLGPSALSLIASIPVAVLAGFLAFTGLFHAWLASSLRGPDLVVALVMGVIGVVTTNLAIALGAGLGVYGLVAAGRRRSPAPAPD